MAFVYARQNEINASIASKAHYEYLYDKPYEDNKKSARGWAFHRREPVASPHPRVDEKTN